jgi:hypothetical protein
MKGVQSKEKLAYKGVLLNLVVKKEVRIRALSIVFNTTFLLLCKDENKLKHLVHHNGLSYKKAKGRYY